MQTPTPIGRNIQYFHCLTYSPPPSACRPHCSRARWWRCRCTGLNPAVPHWSASGHRRPPCASMEVAPAAWTKWSREGGHLTRRSRRRKRWRWEKNSSCLFFSPHDGAELTGGLARHSDRVSLHHRHLPCAHWRQRRPEPTLHKDLHLHLRHTLSTSALADVDARVVGVDGGPLRRERRLLLFSLWLWLLLTLSPLRRPNRQADSSQIPD